MDEDFAELDRAYKSGDMNKMLTSMSVVFKDVRLEVIDLRQRIDALEDDLEDTIRSTLDKILEEKVRGVLEDMT